jgi:hypothetical protein
MSISENKDFYNSLLNFWESAKDNQQVNKIKGTWPVSSLIKCGKFKNAIGLQGVISLLCYYAVEGL